MNVMLLNQDTFQVDTTKNKHNKLSPFKGPVAMVITGTLRAMLRRLLKKFGEA